MQKKILALAVAGLMSGAAFAQSNVTIYGVVDAYYANGKGTAGNTNSTTDKFSGINAGGLSGSRIGFRGTEDLGGGMKAAFVLELGTADTTANATTNTANVPGTSAAQSTTTNGLDTWRQAYVGLTGNFGTVVAGRLQNPGFDFAGKYDAHGASIFSPVGQLSDNRGLSISGRDALGRLDNAAAYISPNLSGFTLKAAYAFGEQIKGVPAIRADGAADATDMAKPQTVWALAADYDAGPLSVGGVYHDLNDIGGTRQGVGARDRKEWALGARYNFGVVTPFVSYQKSKETVGNGGATTKNNLWNIGARIPVMSAGSIGVAYARLSHDVTNATRERAKSWGFDYRHDLSKRTTAYVGYSTIKNSAGIGYELQNLRGSATGQLIDAAAGGKSSQIAAGLRHTF